MTPQIFICSSLILVLGILAYHNYDPYNSKDYEHLINILPIQDFDLKIALESLCSDPKCHLKALELLEKYPKSTHILYRLYLMTYVMTDYEESLEILKKLNKLLPENKIIKELSSNTLIKIKEELVESRNIEKDLFSNSKMLKTPMKNNNFLILEGLRHIKQKIDLEFYNFIEKSKMQITENLCNLKMKKNFSFISIKLKIFGGFIPDKWETFIRYLIKQRKN